MLEHEQHSKRVRDLLSVGSSTWRDGLSRLGGWRQDCRNNCIKEKAVAGGQEIVTMFEVEVVRVFVTIRKFTERK